MDRSKKIIFALSEKRGFPAFKNAFLKWLCIRKKSKFFVKRLLENLRYEAKRGRDKTRVSKPVDRAVGQPF